MQIAEARLKALTDVHTELDRGEDFLIGTIHPTYPLYYYCPVGRAMQKIGSRWLCAQCHRPELCLRLQIAVYGHHLMVPWLVGK